jgi:hypothetical protein
VQVVVQFPQWSGSVVVFTQTPPQQVGSATVQMDGYSQMPAGLQMPAAPWHGPGVLQTTGMYWQAPVCALQVPVPGTSHGPGVSQTFCVYWH